MKTLLVMVALLVTTPASAQVLSIDGLCKNLPAYVQEEGVEFKANTDDVVPADLNAIRQPIVNPVEIPVTVDLEQRFNLNIQADIELESDVAIVKVHPDGRVEYNGQDITKHAYAACAQDASEKPETPDGQQGADTVKSEPEKMPEKPAAKESEKIQIKEGIEGEILEGQYP